MNVLLLLVCYTWFFFLYLVWQGIEELLLDTCKRLNYDNDYDCIDYDDENCANPLYLGHLQFLLAFLFIGDDNYLCPLVSIDFKLTFQISHKLANWCMKLYFFYAFDLLHLVVLLHLVCQTISTLLPNDLCISWSDQSITPAP